MTTEDQYDNGSVATPENIEGAIKNWKSYPKHLTVTIPDASRKSAEEALKAIQNRSFAGRNVHLGKMINCQVCGMRHRENERRCEQRIVVELKPPKGTDQLTVKQILGAARFAKKRIKPRKG